MEYYPKKLKRILSDTVIRVFLNYFENILLLSFFIYKS
jgi:hypothetical protein